jgi:type IV secretory pathway TrbF-like protein
MMRRPQQKPRPRHKRVAFTLEEFVRDVLHVPTLAVCGTQVVLHDAAEAYLKATGQHSLAEIDELIPPDTS